MNAERDFNEELNDLYLGDVSSYYKYLVLQHNIALLLHDKYGDNEKLLQYTIDKLNMCVNKLPDELKNLTNYFDRIALHDCSNCKVARAFRVDAIENTNSTEEAVSYYNNKIEHCMGCDLMVNKNNIDIHMNNNTTNTCDNPVNNYPDNIENKEHVNHPQHYNFGKFECIDVMIDVFGKQAVIDFCKINAFKYLWRTEHKNGTEDMKKASWYLNKALELTDKTEEE